jgi:hypothetical protein
MNAALVQGKKEVSNGEKVKVKAREKAMIRIKAARKVKVPKNPPQPPHGQQQLQLAY